MMGINFKRQLVILLVVFFIWVLFFYSLIYGLAYYLSYIYPGLPLVVGLISGLIIVFGASLFYMSYSVNIILWTEDIMDNREIELDRIFNKLTGRRRPCGVYWSDSYKYPKHFFRWLFTGGL